MVVANGTHARIFSGTSPIAELSEVEVLENPRGARHEGDLVSDRPGRNQDQPGPGRSAVNETTRKEESVDDFAGEIYASLRRRYDTGMLDRLTIVASPAMLGRLRSMIGTTLARTVIEEVDKDLTTHTASDIQQRLDRLRV